MYLIGRARLIIGQHELERMTWGQWYDVFKSYKEIYNFETKQMLYKDVEDESRQYQLEHQPVTSILDL